jgi:GR25 family glycosyltransferase involved in LPS biosynthesis
VDKIPVFIIRTPNSERIIPLLSQLSKCRIFEVVIVDATMGKDLNEPTLMSRTFEMRHYGRYLTQNERACAISHTQARKQISDTGFGGVVLEDDARIWDHLGFEQAVKYFLENHKNKAGVLSLLSYVTEIPIGSSTRTNPRIHKLFAESPLAVATAITPVAARELVDSATKYSQTADWPTSRCKFYVLESGVVKHGDENTESIIGETIDRVHHKTNPMKSLVSLIRLRRRILQKLDLFRINQVQSR